MRSIRVKEMLSTEVIEISPEKCALALSAKEQLDQKIVMSVIIRYASGKTTTIQPKP